MQKNILVRSIAALSGIVMLASVAACGDNTATTTDNSSSSDFRTGVESFTFPIANDLSVTL